MDHSVSFFTTLSWLELSKAKSSMEDLSRQLALPTSEVDVEVLARLRPSVRSIYSAGISTAGLFEIAAMRSDKHRTVVATSIDVDGLEFTKTKCEDAKAHMGSSALDGLTVRFEDFTGPLSSDPRSFDLVYSRLALHYLPPDARRSAIQNLSSLVRSGGAMAIAVRSTASIQLPNGELRPHVKSWDPKTSNIEYWAPDGGVLSQTRYLVSASEIAADFKASGIELTQPIEARLETTFADYQRSVGGGKDHILFAIGKVSGG